MRALALLAVAGMLAGCSGVPRRSSTWVDPTVRNFRFDRAMVVGVDGAGDRRRSMEYEAMEAARAWGLELMPASALVPEDSTLTQGRITELVKKEDFEAVLTLEVLREGERTERVRGGKEVLNQEIFDSFLRHYITVRQEVLLPDS